LAVLRILCVQAKIYTTEIPNYTWSTLSVAGNGTQQLGTAGSWQQQVSVGDSRLLTSSTVLPQTLLLSRPGAAGLRDY